MSTLTIPPYATNPRQDAIDLHKAFKGFGCDTETVINILAHRDATHRALIQQEYHAMYSEELSRRVNSELSGHMKRAMVLWLLDPATRDATVLRQALTEGAIDVRAATEVICSRTPAQLQTIKQIYYAKFHTHLERDLGLQTSGDLSKLLLAHLGVVRHEGLHVDFSVAQKDAKDLYKAGEKRLGTDENTFIHIFTSRSSAHLAAVASCYHDMYGSKLDKVVKKETSGNFEFALLTILRCAQNPAKYFAKELYKSMKGLGTTDSTLIRIIVTRTEIDMQYIKGEYHRKYKKTLKEAVHSETSGNYRTFLLALVGH